MENTDFSTSYNLESRSVAHSSTNVTSLHLALPPLADQYRAACADDLALTFALLRHPSASNLRHRERMDHSFSLPDGHRVTLRTSKIRVPKSLVDRLALEHAEYLLLKDEPMFIYSVSVRLENATEVVDRRAGYSNRSQQDNRRRARAVVQAMHRRVDAQYLHANGSDPALPGRRFSWIGTRDARPLPSPSELFSPRSRVA
nr:hypothetical protein [Corynebacterium lactis]